MDAAATDAKEAAENASAQAEKRKKAQVHENQLKQVKRWTWRVVLNVMSLFLHFKVKLTSANIPATKDGMIVFEEGPTPLESKAARAYDLIYYLHLLPCASNGKSHLELHASGSSRVHAAGGTKAFGEVC